MTAIICGGPEPRAQAACYGGCYEWCIASGWCSTAEDDLTDKQRSIIRRFQKRAGGIFPNDLREVGDWGLTESQRQMLASLDALEAASPRNRTARALATKGLIDWWPNDLEADWYDPVTYARLYPEPGHWHLMGEGNDVRALLTGGKSSLCRCVGGGA